MTSAGLPTNLSTVQLCSAVLCAVKLVNIGQVQRASYITVCVREKREKDTLENNEKMRWKKFVGKRELATN